MAQKHSRQRIIVLFEDDPKRQDEPVTQIQKALHGSGRVAVFKDEDLDATIKGPAEARLVELLKSKKYNHGQIGLIVCDRDLTMYAKTNAQSDRVVSEVAERLGVPICLYEARSGVGLVPLATLGRWKQREIVVEASDPLFGQKCAGLYRGFERIRVDLQKIKRDFKKMTPSDILARILHKEEELDQIALYGAGEQGILMELLPYYDQSRSNTSAIRGRYHRVLGNWLYNSILRFPGIFVNEAAAASYLGIAVKDFAKKQVQKLFEKALYVGPFADCGKWWWRRELDRTIAAARCETGFEYVNRVEQVRPCHCSEGNHPKAGYYCMILQKPVCEEHSRGGISWFPSGADLARVSSSEFDKIGPFVGLY
jgi:hypothetical protein